MSGRRAQIVLLAIGFWVLFGAISGTQVWISMISHGHSLPRVVACKVLVWVFWIPLSFAIYGLARRRPIVPPRPANVVIHLLVGAMFGVLHAAWWALLEIVIVPYDSMNPTDFGVHFRCVVMTQMSFELLMYALVALTVYAGEYYSRFRERELSAARLERSLSEARLHALKLQLQPHFLFNTLNAVGFLVRSGQNREAVGMISGLSDILRYGLEHSSDEGVSLEEEIAVIRRFLDIQRLRFTDRLIVEIDVAADARQASVPVLLLQPVVENAVRHGIEGSDGPGRLTVRAVRVGPRLRIEVFNTGRLSPARRDGIGLANTRARLGQLYGDRYTFELVEEAGGVVARFVLPWSESP